MIGPWLRAVRAGLSQKRDFGLGIADQAVLSGSSFLLTLLLAARLEATSFGLFSIAAAFLPLVDVFFKGFFEDGLPAAAQRIPKARWPKLRTTLYLSTLALSSVISIILAAVGILIIGINEPSGALLCALAIAIPASRMQSLFRRFCFLNSALSRLLVSSLIYFLAGSMAVVTLILVDALNAASAMITMAVASTLAISPLVLFPRELRRPSMRDASWAISRLSRSGGWFVATSFVYWVGSIGLIPACGLFSSYEAGGAIRIIIVIFAPLSQLSTAIVAVKVPRIAKALRGGSRYDAMQIGRQNAFVLGSLATGYSLLLLLASPFVLPELQQRGFDITIASILLMGLALTMDAIWYALALPLIAVGQPKMYLMSRLAGLGALGLVLPGAVYSHGVTGAIASMCVSSAASLVFLSLRNGLVLPGRALIGSQSEDVAGRDRCRTSGRTR